MGHMDSHTFSHSLGIPAVCGELQSNSPWFPNLIEKVLCFCSSVCINTRNSGWPK